MFPTRAFTAQTKPNLNTFNRSLIPCNKVLRRYRSTKHHTLHTIPQEIFERCQIWWPGNWSPSTNSLIWICNVEVIPYISINVHRWVNGCMSAVLGHQNESEQIVTPVRFQTSTLYSTQTMRFRTGVPSWTVIVCRPVQHTKRCRCFWDILYSVRLTFASLHTVYRFAMTQSSKL